jgi:hypothetical protein
MNLVYFSHSYRKEDANFVQHFGNLIQSEGITPSLDPPSSNFGAAKLMRQLNSCDGLVSVLSSRPQGSSAYILFEISQCLKARKPLLVFVEDILDDSIIPGRLLQRRFSRRFFLRQVREHQHAIQILKDYLGESCPPKYQPYSGKKTCLLVGLTALPDTASDVVCDAIKARNYAIIDLQNLTATYEDSIFCETINSADLAICLVDSEEAPIQYLIGAIAWACVPSITLTTDSSYEYVPTVPRSCQPQCIDPSDVDLLEKLINKQLDIFEEESIELDDAEEWQDYAKSLMSNPHPGRYEKHTRETYIQNFGTLSVGGNIQEIHADEVVFNNTWQKYGESINLNELYSELKTLNEALQTDTTLTDAATRAAATDIIDTTMDEAKAKNGPGVLKGLAKLTKYKPIVLEVAKKVGINVGTAAIMAAFALL